ncbi:MAG TPA: hypothetical protein PK957_04045 [Candidatus Dojkabacteria bacterium]|nr:hypothetical protein [Candidatus Dojkabacteria bacterium]HQF36237.1 hypothetical protein [Candidatus Dojkabacteria bacterium]
MNNFQYYKKLKLTIDKALLQSQCLTISSVYKAGISSNLSHMIDHFYNFPKFLFLWIDINNEDKVIESGLIEEINYRITDKIPQDTGFVGILKGLKSIISQNSGIKIVLIIENSQELFASKSYYKSNIKKLLSNLTYSFICFFLVQEELQDLNDLKTGLVDLYPYFSSNILFFQCLVMKIC